MTVYVDNMQASYGRMKMCHMVADSTDELLAMADRIGVARKWLQKAGTAHAQIGCSTITVYAVRLLLKTPKSPPSRSR